MCYLAVGSVAFIVMVIMLLQVGKLALREVIKLGLSHAAWRRHSWGSGLIDWL